MSQPHDDEGPLRERIIELQAEVNKLVDDAMQWRQLALHALHDLRMLGVPIEQIILMTPEVLAAVDEYDREQTSYT